MSFINGSFFRIKITDTNTGLSQATFWHSQSCTLSLSVDSTDITTKDTGQGSGWSESFLKNKSGEITANGLVRVDQDGTTQANLFELFTMFDNRLNVAFQFIMEQEGGGSLDGGVLVFGQAAITAVSSSAEADTESGWDVTLTTQGKVNFQKMGTPPTAVLSATGQAGAIAIDASGSSAGAGSLSSYSVEAVEQVGGADQVIHLSSTASTFDLPASAGTFDVTLTVTQVDGLKSAPVTQTGVVVT